MNLFHLSDDPAISRFEPRPSAYTEEPVVWAISDQRVANYLLPRDCPRVCFRAGAGSQAEDIERFLGADRVVIAIEEAWVDRLRAGRLHRYTMPATDFVLQDEGAGYWVSYGAIEPVRVELVEDLPAALLVEGVSLRVMPSLWALHDEVRASSLTFSMIRMRNAGAR